MHWRYNNSPPCPRVVDFDAVLQHTFMIDIYRLQDASHNSLSSGSGSSGRVRANAVTSALMHASCT